MYCAVSGSSNTVSVSSVTEVVKSLVQVTLVAGPPMEIQVRVNWELSVLRSEVKSRVDIVTRPEIVCRESQNGGQCDYEIELI